MPSINISDLNVEFPIYGVDRRRLISRSGLKTILPLGGQFIEGSGGLVVVKAISDFSINIKNGDRVGLIGHNGAGKSTLLRSIAGIFPVTSGLIDIRGKVASLFSIGLGLDMNASGYENIRILAMMRGVPRQKIDYVIEDVENFTQLGSFLSMPLRTYSKGMSTRLAFATVTAQDAEILVIDEGIGAGDALFHEQAAQRIENLYARTPILIIASHSNDLLRRHCNKGLVMNAGKKAFFGDITDALSYYDQTISSQKT